ncbi:MAG: hypothetical protein IT405_01625 [Candidatus Yanofskybacteria bacterium]|nr:hypothetical protein [Candidatus Yanofskybacteria bacterium]
MQKRYWLRRPGLPWREVSRERYIRAERTAGFRSKSEFGPATAAFSNGIIAGTTTTGRTPPPMVLPVDSTRRAK